ncbi:unnamed protein product [Ambrosiozyma monospora]|uniref:Unnamed protein product n=1 Tax=Ambrosiozyma monospora TaxID=43982 RepID=A0ACB5TCR6_AMBMO|nr:unnamed protein product [Ambrosiozyma monospora]
MGLAAPRNRQRFGIDPRNTNWSNDTTRFGHQHLMKLGWNPGSGLGMVNHAITSHIKVSVKTDNMGLGANLARKRAKKDEFDSGECTGLDVFQRLLGRLNGKEEQINDELERQREERIINGKWGVSFVKGDTLRSTWDAEKKELIESKKRKIEEVVRSDDDDKSSDDDEDEEPKSKKSKKDKKDKKSKKSKKDKSKKELKDSSSKKDKKDKKSKKSKDKKDKKEKKHHHHSKSKSSDEEVTRESMLKPKEAKESSPAASHGRAALRSKWIKQKRAAVMDEKALQEIFMVK